MSAPDEATSQLTAGVMKGLELSIAALADRVHALARRCIASQRTLDEDVSFLLAGATACGKDVRKLSLRLEKAMEGAAEEARVCAAQLAANAELLELEAGCVAGEGMSVAAAARALLCSRDRNGTGFVALVCHDQAAALRAVDEAMRIRDSVDLAWCGVSGLGVTSYQVGYNSVDVLAVDTAGAVVESVEAEDVCVRVGGGSVTRMAVKEAGVVEVTYHVPTKCTEGEDAPVTVGVSVCGAALRASPWAVPHRICWDSAILASVDPERWAAFQRKLAKWLPNRAYTLLYSGNRDGMTAPAFHERCDNKGPTLVLVQCSEGWVFGGYAGASWESPLVSKSIASADAFVFSVTGPYTKAPVLFPVKEDRVDKALYCHADYGPVFQGGLHVRGGYKSPNFDSVAYSAVRVGMFYEDTLGMQWASFTGSEYFFPAAVEVYSITRT